MNLEQVPNYIFWQVSQISCFDTVNRAPPGCTQWFRGNSGQGQLKTFNFDQGIHLADQNQIMCIRRENGNCRICFYAAAAADVQLSGKNTKGVVKQSSCCGYGSNGMKSTGVYDCIIIPGAVKASDSAAKPSKQCGGMKGLVTATNGLTMTVCCKYFFYYFSCQQIMILISHYVSSFWISLPIRIFHRWI